MSRRAVTAVGPVSSASVALSVLTEQRAPGTYRRARAGQEDRALALAVSEALAELPLPQRQVLTLRFSVDLTVRDIALVLDVPEGTRKGCHRSRGSALSTSPRAARTRSSTTTGIRSPRTSDGSDSSTPAAT
ncbi:sigma factor-like helix-turn-helix DNA-binding protein [Streptomyces sp. NPDC127098]|uniref:sigma factor-like helix-turn-helix DNA-binding protein n=1 Tax=Streptomyces sp. NPDC127098 TaxID=3347137 RepID=UPI003668A268